MSLGRDRRLAAGLAIGVSLLTLVPFFVASRTTPPGWVFSGFMLNPYDGFSYLAKMRQGLEGNWQFVLPYTAQPGSPSFLFVYYLGLGHLARLGNLPLGTAFHAARALGGTVMYLSIYGFLEHLAFTRAARWSAFALVLCVSGFGWIGVSLGLVASDLLIPESIPWLSTLVNPHFPLAVAGLTLGFLAALSRGPVWRAGGLAAMAGLVLGMVQPFVLATLWCVLGTWAVVEQVLQWPGGGVAQPRRRVLTVLAASGLTGLPWVVYDYWLVTTNPALKSWSLQNVTPSPSLVAYLVGFGPLVLWSAVALVRARPLREPSLRLVATWAVVGIVLLYLPFGLQRRLSLGLAIPLAALAGVGIDRLCRNPARKRLAVIGTILVTVPSLLLVVGAGLASATTAASPTVLSEAEIEAYDWMAENLPPDSLVLAAMQTGNRIPAWMSALVLAGHPFETPDAQAELAWIARAYGWQADPASGLAMLKQREVEYVYRGREERALGNPTWLQALTPVYTSGEVSLYSVVP